MSRFDEYGLYLQVLTDEEKLDRMDDLAARQVMVPGSRAFELLTRLLRGQITRNKLSVDEREAKTRARNKRSKRGTPRSSAFKTARDARAAMSPEEILASNADFVAKDRKTKKEYRARPEVLARSRELQRGYRLRQGVPVQQARLAEAAIPTPTLAAGLTWPAMPALLPKFARAHPGDGWDRPDDAMTRRIRELLAAGVAKESMGERVDHEGEVGHD